MEEKEIFCDLDGVIVDCLRPALRYHGRHDLASDPLYPPTYEWSAGTGIDPNKFWDGLEQAGPTFWSELPFTNFGEDLLLYLLTSKYGVEIATKVVGANNSSGKWTWAQRCLPSDVRFHMTTDKSSLARPGRLLIDDSPSNVKEWRARGGDAILVPATYNDNRCHIGREFDYIKEQMVELGYV